jgi:toxin ParE1/3/4
MWKQEKSFYKDLTNFVNSSYDDLQLGLRGLPLEGYIILYRLTDNGIEIVRVANGRQDLQSLFDRLN